MPDPILLVLAGVFLVLALLAVTAFFLLLRLWLRAALVGAPVSLLRILAMRLRGNRPGLLIDAYVRLRLERVMTTIEAVEKVYIENRNRVYTTDDLVELVKRSANAGHGG
jgi:uncharacterized protein YqfA (UPF0365 family)